MSVRIHNKIDNLTQLHSEIETRFSNSLLSILNNEFKYLISIADENKNNNSHKLIINWIKNALSFLPSQDQLKNDRFLFDASLLQNITSQWKSTSLYVSNMLIPVYVGDWSYEQRSLPVFKEDKGKVMHMISFPEKCDLNDVDLLDYPLLLHELGHYLLRLTNVFKNNFKKELDLIIKSFRFQSITDNNVLRDKNLKLIDRIIEKWSPSEFQNDWSSEIGSDIFGIWLCGPAYIATYEDLLERNELNPYKINSSHPPLALRSEIVIETANQLEWGKYCDGINKKVKDWKGEVKSEYSIYNNKDIFNSLIKNSLDTFNLLCIPKCDQTKIDQIYDNIGNKKIVDLGIDTLIAAWAIYKKYNKEYHKWQTEILRNYINLLTD